MFLKFDLIFSCQCADTSFYISQKNIEEKRKPSSSQGFPGGSVVKNPKVKEENEKAGLKHSKH